MRVSRLSLGPTMCAESFAAMDLDEISRRAGTEIRAISTDNDKTMVDQDQMEVCPEYLAKIKGLGEQGCRLGFLSNADDIAKVHRLNSIAEQAAGALGAEVPCVASYFVGHRKPHRSMYQMMAERLDTPPEQICHVGDQWFKDVIGANRAGYGATVLVPPYGTASEHPATHYLQRPAEALLRPVMGLPLRTADFGRTLEKSEGYRRAKQTFAGAAAVAALTGGIGLAEGQLLFGALGEATAAGFVDAALVTRRAQTLNATYEALRDLGRLGRATDADR